MDTERSGPKSERRIAQTRADLPPLKEGYARVVHLTGADLAEKILGDGLDYKRHGMLMSTARTYDKEEDAIYGTDDPRFSGPTVVAVVMDVPIDELRIHEAVGKAPGRIPPEYIVGVIPSEK